MMYSKWIRGAIAIATLLLTLGSSACDCENQDFAEALSEISLALYHAPILYQDTDDTDPQSDYITKLDYDNNIIFSDNWDNRDNYPLIAAGYFSIVESRTHWFIIYGFFHPRDWTDSSFDQEHENDLEGLLAIVEKDGTTYGKLIGAITVFHLDFYSYKASDSSLTDGHEDIDGVLYFQNTAETILPIASNDAHHPMICQEAKGHGLKAWPHTGDFTGKADEDGIIYFPSIGSSDIPSSGNDRYVEYGLFTFGELWERQLEEANLSLSTSTTFASWGTFKGDKSGGCGNGIFILCSEDSANAPWGWDDKNDGATYRGEIALDPIHLVDHYFNGLGTFSQMYIKNRYLEDLRDKQYSSVNLPRGWPSELNLDSMLAKLP